MFSTSSMTRRLHMTLGQEACDLAIRHVHVVDVFNCLIIANATVFVGDGQILFVHKEGEKTPACFARETLDAGGRFLLPGLMDAHIHLESTMLTPERFAQAVLPFGTTRVVADPHEIANVAGVTGLQYMLDAAQDLPLRIHFALPSCVPCTPFEDAGAELLAEDLQAFMQNPRVCSLGEVMNYPGVISGNADLLAKISAAKQAGLTVDGHCPLAHGEELAAYIGCGIGNDHESSTEQGMRRKIAAGLYIFIRHGSAATSLEKLLPAITPYNARRCCLCTDDMHAGDILRHGHINYTLAKAVALGLDASVAVSMATLNPARAYGLNKVGAIAPGFCADLCLVDDLQGFHVHTVWISGKKVVDEGRLLAEIAHKPVPQTILNSVHVSDFSEKKLEIVLPSKRARVIALQPHSLVTEEKIMNIATTADGKFSSELNPDLCKIAVVERHRATGRIGLGLLLGYTKAGSQLGGAIATSIAHDSHNIVVAGSNDADMSTAVQEVIAMQGGIALISQNRVLVRVPLPVGGIMSQAEAIEVARLNDAVQAACKKLSISEDVDPVLTLAFMPLCVIPKIKLNTKGLFDVEQWRFVDIDVP